MLPGFRFLFAAILLSMSILIFGLGAAALLRAAHEEFASNPTWRAPPETVFAQQSEPNKPVLAMLVVDPPAAEPKKPETLVTTVPDQPAAIAAAPAEPEQAAAPKAEEATPREVAKSEPTAETPPTSEPAPVEAKPAAEPPAAATETKMAAIEESEPRANETAAAPPEQASAPAVSEADKAATRIATLGGPLVTVETPQLSKAESAEPDRRAIKKRQRARRARERRRIAALRAQLARQAALQPATDPFGLIASTATTASAATPINPPHIR
jgi:hypothetical protein